MISFTLVVAVGVRIAFSKVARRPRNRDINMPRWDHRTGLLGFLTVTDLDRTETSAHRGETGEQSLSDRSWLWDDMRSSVDGVEPRQYQAVLETVKMQLHPQSVSLTLHVCIWFICDELTFGFGVTHFTLCCLKTGVHKEYKHQFRLWFTLRSLC